MVRYRRNFVPGGTYFFTVALADRTSSALVDHIRALRMAFRIARRERPFTTEAIVILPDHLHAVWTLPPGDSDFSGRWKRIKACFTHRLVAAGVPVKRHRIGEYTLWQRRFWEHTIRNGSDFARHVDYIHFNPVKHKLVSRARDWRYSSFHLYVRRGLKPADWAGDVDEPMTDFGEPRGVIPGLVAARPSSTPLRSTRATGRERVAGSPDGAQRNPGFPSIWLPGLVAFAPVSDSAAPHPGRHPDPGSAAHR